VLARVRWPKAIFISARVNMAFGQTMTRFFDSWGVAPGYGERWPSAKKILCGLAARKRPAEPLAAIVRAQTPQQISRAADPVLVDVPGFLDVAGLECVVDDLFQQVERRGIGRILAR
jgi:hypothetical protein